jgi:thioredoxin 1
MTARESVRSGAIQTATWSDGPLRQASPLVFSRLPPHCSILHFRRMFCAPATEIPVSDLITHVNDDAFEQQVLKSETPVLLDFWAEWCGPCKAMSPMLDELAKQYEGKLRIVKVNIDHNQQTPRTYGVRGIPTLMVFKNGKVEATQIGAVSKGHLTQMIDKAI